MARVYLVMSATMVGLAAYVVLGGAVRTPRADADAHLLATRLARLLGRAAARLSSTGVVASLVGLACVRRSCDALLERIAQAPGDGPRLCSTREETCGLALLAWAGSAVAAIVLFASPLTLVLSLVGPPVAVLLLDGSEQRRREQELCAEMPDVFRTLAMAMGAGETLAQAVDYVAIHERGPAGEAFLRASMRLRCGVGASEALGTLADELEAPGVGLLVTALLISQRTGSPLRELFQSTAVLVERQGEFERLLSVKTAQVRLSVRVVCILPALMVGLLSLISADFQAGLATFPGFASVAVAALMDGAALLIIRSLMKGVL